MDLKWGVDPALEEEADILLREGRRGATKHSEMGDYLSPEQWELRERREKLTPTGNFDLVAEPGIYGRTYAPRPPRPTGRFLDPWGQDLYEAQLGGGSDWYYLNASADNITSGSHYEPGPHRDPRLPIDSQLGRYGHLDRCQRSRIRRVLRKIPVEKVDARAVVKGFFALKYDLPMAVIERVCVDRE